VAGIEARSYIAANKIAVDSGKRGKHGPSAWNLYGTSSGPVTQSASVIVGLPNCSRAGRLLDGNLCSGNCLQYAALLARGLKLKIDVIEA